MPLDVDSNRRPTLENEQRGLDLIALDQALDKLSKLDSRQGRIVEMRFFGGLTEDEIAEVLGVSPITVKRAWRMAKTFLLHQLGEGALEGGVPG